MSTDWSTVFLFLVVGLGVGGLMAWAFGRRGGPQPRETEASPASAETVRDLEAQRDGLIAQLRELDETGSKMAPEDRAALGRELELRAAEVLQRLEEAEQRHRAALSAATRPASAAGDSVGSHPTTGRKDFLRGYLWGAGSAAFVAILLSLIVSDAGERAPGMPPTGTIPGSDTQGAAPQTATEDPEIRALRQRAESGDAEAQLDLAQALIFHDRLIDAWEWVKRAYAQVPEHPRGLTYESVVRLAMGQTERARELLDQAVAKDPSLTEAWVRRGVVAFEQGDYAGAVESWETALEQRPDGRSAIGPALEEAKQRLERGDGPPPAAAAQPAPKGSATEARATAGAEIPAGTLRIRVDLAPEAKARFQPGSTLFVYARSAEGAPPAAARRVEVRSFPVEIVLGPEHTMMGQPFPEEAIIEARLDEDGDAMTRNPDDPAARQTEIRPGTSLDLVLR